MSNETLAAFLAERLPEGHKAIGEDHPETIRICERMLDAADNGTGLNNWAAQQIASGLLLDAMQKQGPQVFCFPSGRVSVVFSGVHDTGPRDSRYAACRVACEALAAPVADGGAE